MDDGKRWNGIGWLGAGLILYEGILLPISIVLGWGFTGALSGLVFTPFGMLFVGTAYLKGWRPSVSSEEAKKTLRSIAAASVAIGGIVCVIGFFVSAFMGNLTGLLFCIGFLVASTFLDCRFDLLKLDTGEA